MSKVLGGRGTFRTKTEAKAAREQSRARRAQLLVPHLIDSELAGALRRRVAPGRSAADDGWNALDTWRRLGVTRYPVFLLLDRVWELQHVSSYDASYVALAESLDCALLPADARLAGAPGLRCPVTVVTR